MLCLGDTPWIIAELPQPFGGGIELLSKLSCAENVPVLGKISGIRVLPHNVETGRVLVFRYRFHNSAGARRQQTSPPRVLDLLGHTIASRIARYHAITAVWRVLDDSDRVAQAQRGCST